MQGKKLPPIGMRIIKSAVAVLICYLISFIRGDSGIVFYSQLAALWCIQSYKTGTKRNASQRFLGTVVGAVYGLIFLLFRNSMTLRDSTRYIFDALVISVMIIIVLYTTVIIKKKHASYFSCVVFLSIVVNHIGDVNPYLFVWNRFLDTIIGIAVGYIVNIFSLPVDKQEDILFISGLDDTLLHKNDNLSDYSKVELNRMLDDGVKFTLSTRRTPASLLKPMQEIRLKLPVIAMDGAVLYDIQENNYLRVYTISKAMGESILSCIKEMGYTCFINSVIDDVLVIYYDEQIADKQLEIMNKLRKSPYRNYVKMGRFDLENIVYFMMIYPRETAEAIYKRLDELGFCDKLKILLYDSHDYAGYSYIKIYNKNATRDNMLKYLMEAIGVEKQVTFGSIEGKYDVVIEPGDTNKVVRELRRRYEPLKYRRKERNDY